MGEFRKGKLWNITEFGKNENILRKWVNGVMVYEAFGEKKEKLLFLRNENGEWIWLESGNEESDGKYVGLTDKNGIPGGVGTLSLPDGNEYGGEWKDGKYDGTGTLTSPNGDTLEGEWKDGELVVGQRTYFFPDGRELAPWDPITEFATTIYDMPLIYFPHGTGIITPALEEIIEENYEWIAENPDVQIQLEGHCNIGGETHESNLELGEKLAKAVFNYLIYLGANPSQFSMVSFGKERPTVEYINRNHCRVEFTRL